MGSVPPSVNERSGFGQAWPERRRKIHSAARSAIASRSSAGFDDISGVRRLDSPWRVSSTSTDPPVQPSSLRSYLRAEEQRTARRDGDARERQPATRREAASGNQRRLCGYRYANLLQKHIEKGQPLGLLCETALSPVACPRRRKHVSQRGEGAETRESLVAWPSSGERGILPPLDFPAWLQYLPGRKSEAGISPAYGYPYASQ